MALRLRTTEEPAVEGDVVDVVAGVAGAVVTGRSAMTTICRPTRWPMPQLLR
jgi:hypothetical protein